MVKILDGWYYIPEKRQYTLVHIYEREKGVFGKTDQKSGEIVQKKEEVGYFRTLEGMLHRLAALLAKERYDRGEIETLKEYIAALKEIKAELAEICAGN